MRPQLRDEVRVLPVPGLPGQAAVVEMKRLDSISNATILYNRCISDALTRKIKKWGVLIIRNA